jgi:hypothetical protein
MSLWQSSQDSFCFVSFVLSWVSWLLFPRDSATVDLAIVFWGHEEAYSREVREEGTQDLVAHLKFLSNDRNAAKE